MNGTSPQSYLPREINELIAEYESHVFRLQKAGLTFFLQYERECKTFTLPSPVASYKILQAPRFYAYRLTFVPLIICTQDFDLRKLSSITTKYPRTTEDILAITIADTSGKSLKTIKMEAKDDAQLHIINHSFNTLVNIYATEDSKCIILLLARDGSLENTVSLGVSAYFRWFMIEEMRSFLKENIPGVSHIIARPSYSTISFEIDPSIADKYGFPITGSSTRITFSPLRINTKEEGEYNIRNIKWLKDTPFGTYFERWFQRLYNIEHLPNKDEQLMKVYRQAMIENEGLWAYVSEADVLIDKDNNKFVGIKGIPR